MAAYNLCTTTLRETSKFHLISLCGNFVETHSIRRVLSYSPETLQKLCLQKLSTPGKDEYFGILRSVYLGISKVGYFDFPVYSFMAVLVILFVDKLILFQKIREKETNSLMDYKCSLCKICFL